MIVNLYFIKHIPTGYFLRRGPKSNRGSSLFEPAPFSNVTRIYYSQKEAENSLKAWLNGKYNPVWEEDGSYYDRIYPVTTRIKSDMEIIMRSIDI